MVDRLSAVDVSFLYLEGPTTPMHLGNLAVFGPPSAELSYERLVTLVEERIAAVPRYRQHVVWVPGRLANPVWVDDPDFDVSYHVRRSGLPKPGTDAQLREFCARIQSRPLDRRRPLWEMYLIEGLCGGRVAIATKTHYAIVDGIGAIDLEQVLLEPAPADGETREQLWMPGPAPTPAELVLDAVGEIVRRPTAVIDIVRLAARDVRSTVGRAATAAGGLLSAAQIVSSRPRPSPLQARAGERRRFATVRAPLRDFRRIHSDQGVSVNDVVLAVVAGALRGWLLLRGEPVHQTTTLRALVPLSVHDPSRIVPMFIDLPVGESNPLVRLSQIAFATRENALATQAVGATALIAVSGFAPPTLHAVAARLAGGMSNRLFQVAVMNAPGPQHSLYAGTTELSEIYPIMPIGPGQALAIGVTSYDGAVHFGLNADYDAVPDLDQLADLIEQALGELLGANDQPAGAAGRLASVTQVRRTPPRAAAKSAQPKKSAPSAQPTKSGKSGKSRVTPLQSGGPP
jgi:diacylglycerol O-acyltransferase